jgi:hypothetical protein
MALARAGLADDTVDGENWFQHASALLQAKE